MIEGKCDGRDSILFLDTGADINVIDREFVKRTGISGSRIIKANKFIKCANDSRMHTDGWVKLNVQIRDQERYCKFWIVDKIYPNLILGFQAMKKLKIAVDSPENCAWVNNVEVPLIQQLKSRSVSRSGLKSEN